MGASSSARGSGAAPSRSFLLLVVGGGGRHRDASERSRTSLPCLGRQQLGHRLIGSGGGEPIASRLRAQRKE
uniref:Uncharacterized protein n=1 Tax=Oryza sativa subsp. japonica TaxID=39947 RepID=Q6Z5X7_ORYSJ|nr:hypothetical protein [Oryza sativa Japonica Group]BAD01338.1 hypothetical protein [Oryza sativa Japonica Group]